MIRTPTLVVLTVVLTGIWAVVVLQFLSVMGPDWTAYAPASCLGTHCFCELPRRGSLLLQPANSWSSLGFVAVGGWIMLGAGQHPRSALGVWAALWLGFAALVIGVGSVLLHATLTLWGQFADVLGMYLLGAFLLVRGVMRWRSIGPGTAIGLYIVVAGGLIGALFIWPETRRWLFAAVLVTAVLVEWYLARPRRRGVRPELFLLGLAANLLAFAIWILDQSLVWCAPASRLQGHAVWHVLGAAATVCSYGYFRSERR